MEPGSPNQGFVDHETKKGASDSVIGYNQYSTNKQKLSSNDGSINRGFVFDNELGLNASPEDDAVRRKSTNSGAQSSQKDLEEQGTTTDAATTVLEREQWTNGVEFLMSCIAMSVGLGNIWRFPFVAYENGGGAFLIPYIIVLIIIGRPMYFMEMSIGQFTGFSSVKIWKVVPALTGVGWGMLFITAANLTYYVSIMATTVFYFIASFKAELPWATCAPEWAGICFNSSGENDDATNYTGLQSSAELYFVKTVLKEKDQIDDGIGAPDWRLSLCLLIAWVTIYLVIIRGVKSVGKVAYFLALFPYVVLVTLLIRGATLPGAGNGMMYFITPQWDQILNPLVWYAAVSQAFFSLSVSFGSLIMYSSYNNFKHNIYRDALIVTTLDTFTSLLAGFTTFAIIGNLAYEMGTDDLSTVVQSDSGLAFISYPDAIAKFDWCPQLFAVIFFSMLYALGIGSSIALTNAVVTVVCDQFPRLKYWAVATVVSIAAFLAGLVYVTPGGQWILTLVDYYLISFVVFILAVGEVVGIAWIYGMNKFCRDVQFMLGRKNLNIYWRLCWGFVTPVILIVILIYSMTVMEPLTYKDKMYPQIAYTIAWIFAGFGALQIPFWILVKLVGNRDNPSFREVVSASFRPNARWGPKDPKTKAEWQEFRDLKRKEDALKGGRIVRRTWRKLTG